MKIHHAEYIKSAPSLKDCPDFNGLPEIVLVGRSNVGKSSLINSLTVRKNLARTSNTPGKTRYINFYKIAYSDPTVADSPVHEIMLVDLPGYGYAKVSQKEQEHWRKNLESFLLKRDSIALIFQLIDSRHGMQANDIQMYNWLHHHKKPTHLILTKADKISKNELAQQFAKTSKLVESADCNMVLSYSAETHMGRDAVWELITSWES